MLADGDRLLDEVVEVLWDVSGQALRFENAKNLVASHKSHLGHSMRIT